MSRLDSQDPLEQAVALLPALSRWMKQTMSGTGDITCIPVGQLRAVAHLYHHGRCSVGEVASGIGVTLATASELIDRLVDAEWVERQTNPADRRQVQLQLTPRAVEVGDQIHATRRESMRRALERLPEADRAAFVRGLQTLVESVEIPAGRP